jgi:hypothetical protein
MEVNHIKSMEISEGATNREEKQKWVEEHARRLQGLFVQWQKPLGIESGEYRKYLTEELLGYCDEPLLRSLVESIT